MNCPVVVFAYNREEKIKQCIEALSENVGAKETDVFIFSDGARNESDRPKVEAVRNYLDSLPEAGLFQSVCITKSVKNKGLAKSVISGVSRVIDEYGKVIVVEDDLITSPDFLQYMKEALCFYEEFEEYGCISAYTYPVRQLKKYDKDVYVTGKGDCWGWGTWKDRWDKVDWEVTSYAQFMADKAMQKQFDRLQKGISAMLTAQMEGKIDSWAVRWCYHLFRNRLLTVYPKESRTLNIGLDGSGTHCDESRIYETEFDKNIKQCRMERLPVNPALEKACAEFESPGILKRIWNVIKG